MTIKVDKKIHKQVRKIAFQKNVSQAEVVRQALEQYLTGKDGKDGK
jgi:predicted transcriptional regulator